MSFKQSLTFSFLGALIIMNISCTSADEKSESKSTKQEIKGKFAFSSLREGDSAKSWGVYTLVDEKIKKISHGISFPMWSPDGDKLAATTIKMDAFHVYEKDGSLQGRYKIPDSIVTFDWLPDGTGLIYFAKDPTIRDIRLRKYSLNIYKFEGRTNQSLLSFPEGERPYKLFVSPQGDRITFATGTPITNPKVNPYLYVCNLDGSNLQKLLPKASPLGWLPDNKTIIIATNTYPNGKKISLLGGVTLKINVDTRKVEQLKDYAIFSSGVRLSKDGKYIYYSRSTPNKGKGIFALSLETDEEIPITEPFYVNDVVRYSHDTRVHWHQGD